MVLIGCQDNGLVLCKVLYQQFLRSVNDVPGLAETEVSAEELKLAQSLVDSMSKSLADIEIKDTYHAAVKEMMQAKVEGKEVVMAADDEVKPVVDIMTALRESIEAAKGDVKPMERADSASGSEAAAQEDAEAPPAKATKKKAAAKKKPKAQTKSKTQTKIKIKVT